MFDDVSSWGNLLLAYRKASRGKRGQPNVAAFEHRLEDNLFKLQSELRSRSYRPGGYRSFFIHEPKRRLISAAPFRDRVVHHALCNVIEPVFERSFITQSFANRVGKGTHRALAECQRYARRYSFALSCDIRQFFPGIDHAILRSILRRKLRDNRVLWLVDTILQSGEGVLSEEYEMVYFPGDDLFAVNRPRGLPIGNLTSQFWANVYLNPFDHFVKRELGCGAYLRYVDDLLFFAESKALLWEWKSAVEDRLMRFRLSLHPAAHPRPVTEGVPFLGFVTYPQRRRLKRRKGVYYQRRLKALMDQYRRGRATEKKVSASVRGWCNHLRYGNTVGLRKSILGSQARDGAGGYNRPTATRQQPQRGDAAMDIPLLADALTMFLAPALPYLLGLGGKAAEEAAKKLGADTWAKAKNLWGRLRPKVEATQPAALETAQDVVAKPGDEGARAALTYQLRKVLESDSELAEEVERLLDEAGALNLYQARLEGSGAIAQGPGAVAAGERGVAVGGDVHRGNLGTGDRKRGEE